MEKLIIALTLFLGINFVAIGEIARGPSVVPLVEVDIEGQKKSEAVSGYDFNQAAVRKPSHVKARVPANIVTKTATTSPYSYIGPFIFLITLPIGLWIMVSKRFKADPSNKKVDYYEKTHQFKPYQSGFTKSDEDNDDIDYPKAS